MTEITAKIDRVELTTAFLTGTPPLILAICLWSGGWSLLEAYPTLLAFVAVFAALWSAVFVSLYQRLAQHEPGA